MFNIPIITAQSNSPPSNTPQQTIEMELSKFLSDNTIEEFTYDPSLVFPIPVISKTFGTKVATGTIMKDEGKDIFQFIVEEKHFDLDIRKQFESRYNGIYIALRLVGSHQIVSKGQILNMLGQQYGIRILLDLGPPGDYEIAVCYTAIPPPPPKRKKQPWEGSDDWRYQP